MYLIPGAAQIHAELIDAIGKMLAPFEAATLPDAPGRDRLEALSASAPDLSRHRVDGGYIDAITSARRADGDSLHLLVMDAHRCLNRLQAQIATATVDGAAVFELAGGDADLVAAFMAGLHATERLRLDHPGLATTATRAGGRLLIQNDLGTTKAHVVVLAVDACWRRP